MSDSAKSSRPQYSPKYSDATQEASEVLEQSGPIRKLRSRASRPSRDEVETRDALDSNPDSSEGTAFPPSSRSGSRTESVGTTLRRGRLAKDMSLAEVSRVTRIPAHTLEKIESDQYDDLPGEVFVKGFLKAYAQAVAASPNDILARYSASRRVAVVTPLPVTSPVRAAREGQGRRFGVAIALVLLLILFTLAISIVLKPRGRDIPHELSRTDVSAIDVKS